MSDRTRNGKPLAQDLTGVVFCVLGGFFAVSIVLSALGQEPRFGWITWSVVELKALLGGPAAFVLSAGVAAIGAQLFLRRTVMAVARPLGALALGALGVGFLLGAFGVGGEVGAVVPGLPGFLGGFAGKGLDVALGLVLAWAGWTVLPGAGVRHSSAAGTVQRIAPSVRHDSAAGVSAAEAALLVTEPRQIPRPVPRSAPRNEESAPVRDQAIRPHFREAAKETAPAREAVPEAREKRAEAAPAPVRPSREGAAPRPLDTAPPARASAPTSPVQAAEFAQTPPTPSWEEPGPIAAASSSVDADAQSAIEEEDEDEDEALALAEELAEEFEADEIDEEELEEEAPAPAPAAPSASWEQVGLFDEEEAEEEPPARPARAELTPAFDFEAGATRPPAHEPETGEDPFAVEPASERAGQAAVREEVGEEDDEAPAQPGFVLEPVAPAPRPEPKPEPKLARDAEDERWHKLVFDAGCAILDQNRVAVSMLERRFGIDFDQACRVLDELQEAGLIGPYMGGRTRDILLSREEWLAHAPHAS